MEGNLMRTCDAARILGLTPEWVRDLADRGKLPVIRVAGMRLFRPEDVERLRRQREAERRARKREAAAQALR